MARMWKEWRNWVIGILCVAHIINLLVGEKVSCFVSNSIDNEIKNITAKSNNQENNNNAIIGEATKQQQLPNWRIVTDCSIFQQDCAAAHLLQKRYAPHPFSFEARDEHRYHWQSWKRIPPKEPSSILYGVPQNAALEYPPRVSNLEHKNCLFKAYNTTYQEQLKQALSQTKRHKELNMIAFTIADYNYASDMMHDFFQMSWNIVGFQDAIFMVALDDDTLNLACRYGYPIVVAPGMALTKSDDEQQLQNGTANNATGLRDMVQATKFRLSLDLVNLGQDFMFFEMDVWWLQSPTPFVIERLSTGDAVVSAHQDSPYAPNIGVYAAKANNATREFFQICFDFQMEYPKVHDQFIFTEVWNHAKDYPNSHFGSPRWGDIIPPKPNLTYPIKPRFFDMLAFAASEWPIIHEKTLAIHTLCGQPLMTPNGKKMIAKELGAWYGFETTTPTASKAASDVPEQGGYYKRTGVKRRYLMLDGRVNGGYSMNEAKPDGGRWAFYHNSPTLRRTVAVLIAIARWTDRILILPKVMQDRSNAFLWSVLDLQSVEKLVQVRETNFPSNRKSWFSETQPFASVVRTALGLSLGGDHDSKRIWKMFVEPNEGNVSAWKKLPPHEGKYPDDAMIEDWFGLMQGLNDVELLLVDPFWLFERKPDVSPRPDMEDHFILKDLVYVQRQLKWCKGTKDEWEKLMSEWPAGRARASSDCYGKGETRYEF